ncbi:hypothetical protein [Haladaptatus sp. NG-WS-4]
MRRFGESSEQESPYECKGCGASFGVQYQVCPECGGYTIERDDWD